MDIQAAEVKWYKKHGRYPNERIKYDNTGNQYVIGDQCWNKRISQTEWVETNMHAEIARAAKGKHQ